jgi:hypothetical protein
MFYKEVPTYSCIIAGSNLQYIDKYESSWITNRMRIIWHTEFEIETLDKQQMF